MAALGNAKRTHLAAARAPLRSGVDAGSSDPHARTFPECISQIFRLMLSNGGWTTMSKKTLHTLMLVFATLVLAVGSLAQLFLHS